MTFIEIEKGIFVVPTKVTVIKAIDKKKCALFVQGQSALEGFVVERNALDLAREIVAGADEEEDEDGEEDAD